MELGAMALPHLISSVSLVAILYAVTRLFFPRTFEALFKPLPPLEPPPERKEQVPQHLLDDLDRRMLEGGEGIRIDHAPGYYWRIVLLILLVSAILSLPSSLLFG